MPAVLPGSILVRGTHRIYCTAASMLGGEANVLCSGFSPGPFHVRGTLRFMELVPPNFVTLADGALCGFRGHLAVLRTWGAEGLSKAARQV